MSSRRTTRKPTLKEEFQEWANVLDIEPDFIQRQYDVLLEEKVKTFKDLSEKVLVPHVKKALRSNLKRDYGSLISKAPPVRGFFCASSELVDFIDRMRQKAIRLSQEDDASFAEAVANQLINSDGEALDTREKLFGRNQNPYYGQPLDELPEDHVIGAHRRTLYAIGYQKGKDFPQFFSVDFHGKMAIDLEYEFYTPISYRANIITDALLVQQRATPAATRIRTIEEEYNYAELIEETCDIVELAEFDNWHIANSENWDRVICGKANAVVVSEEPHPDTGSTMIIMDDDSLGMEERGHRIYVPDYLPIEFGEETEIYYWGRTGYQKMRDTDEQVVVTNIFGMMPVVKELATPAGYKSGRRVEIDWDDAPVDE